MGKNTYVAVGNKQDVSDLITNICPKETPLYSGFGKGTKATATYHEWLEDTLAPAASNKAIEGAEFVVGDPTPRVRLGNYTQILTKGYGVTGTQEVVQKYGVKSEIGYQMQKAMKEIALDVEYAILNQSTKAAGDAGTARQFGGVPHWINTNKMTNATDRLFSEDLLNSAIQKCWEAGGKPSKVYLSGSQKRKVSTWSGGGVGDKHMAQNDRRLTVSISVYESDFGVVSFVPHRMMDDKSVIVITPEHWKIAYLRPMQTTELPKTGDMHKKHILGELTMEARAEKASAIIANLKL